MATATMSQQDLLKQQAAWKAVEYVKSDMVVGLGTGSTAAFAVDRIGQLLKEGKLKNIIGVPTSIRTYEQALALGIPLATLDEQPHIDVAIDGADEVDPNLDVVKGRGGALLREKMVEMASDKFVCIVDDSKLVKGLGGSKLAMPVEIVQVGMTGYGHCVLWTPQYNSTSRDSDAALARQAVLRLRFCGYAADWLLSWHCMQFCHKYTLQRLSKLPEVAGCEAKLRMNGDKPYVTDNSNYIVDLYFQEPIKVMPCFSIPDAKAVFADGRVGHGMHACRNTT
jgi:ribose 5-phosphate isomerase A